MRQIKIVYSKSTLQQNVARKDEDRKAVAAITAENNCAAFIKHRDAGLPVTYVKNGVIFTQQQGKSTRIVGRVKRINKAIINK